MTDPELYSRGQTVLVDGQHWQVHSSAVDPAGRRYRCFRGYLVSWFRPSQMRPLEPPAPEIVPLPYSETIRLIRGT